jgi:hypothetical protein
MTLAIGAPEVEAEARTMLRETIEASGWYPDLRPPARAERIERDVEQMWRIMAEQARERLEQNRV